MNTLKLPSQEYLREHFEYNKETGVFNKRGKAGGTTTARYLKTRIGKQVISTHRLIWVYMTGEDISEYEIDHINRNTHDNRWCNLRKVDRATNQSNTTASCIRKRQRPKPYQARMRVQGKDICKSFFTHEEAHTFVIETKKELLK